LNLRKREIHHVLDTTANIHETQAVILHSQGGEGGELLFSRLLVGGFIGKPGKNHARTFRHGNMRGLELGDWESEIANQ